MSVLLMAGLGIYISISNYSFSQTYGQTVVLDSNIFSHILLVPIVFSVFCSLFIGTEYSDGTIRNKIVVGHTRRAIYLANLTVLLFTLCAAGICLTVSSLLTLIAMLCHSKAITTVLCILGMIILLFTGTYIRSRLSQPETYSDYSYSVNGELVSEGEHPNPLYLRGNKRKVYEFLYDFLPSGQSVQCQEMSSEHPGILLLYSGIILIASSGAGLCIFRRKDIK